MRLVDGEAPFSSGLWSLFGFAGYRGMSLFIIKET